MVNTEDEKNSTSIAPIKHQQPPNISITAPYVDTHSDIGRFLSFLTKNKNISTANIASAVHCQVEIDPRVPHPLTKKSKGTTNTVQTSLRPFELSLSGPKYPPLGFEIHKFTWPKKQVIEDFMGSEDHCKGNKASIEKRKFLWEKLKRAYEKEFNDFKKLDSKSLNSLGPAKSVFPQQKTLPSKTRRSTKQMYSGTQNSQYRDMSDEEVLIPTLEEDGRIVYISQKEQEKANRREDHRSTWGCDPEDME